MWQRKDFQWCVLGSVARKGVVRRFLGCVAGKGVRRNRKWKRENGNVRSEAYGLGAGMFSGKHTAG